MLTPANRTASLDLTSRQENTPGEPVGTDWPHLTTQEHVIGLQKSGVFNEAELKMVDRDNALRLMPTLRPCDVTSCRRKDL